MHRGTRPPDDAVDPAHAFDLLYVANARALHRQSFLLCGHRGTADRAIVHAFRRAWKRWPEVAADPDPAGWVRAAAYGYVLAPWRYALTPWRRTDRGRRCFARISRVERAALAVPPADRPLLTALWSLPASYRAALLLHDGIGLSLPAVAAETEAGDEAASWRLRNGRAELARRFAGRAPGSAHRPGPGPSREVSGPGSAGRTGRVRSGRAPDTRAGGPAPDLLALSVELSVELRELAQPQPVRLTPAPMVRQGGERAKRRRTGLLVGLAAALLAAVAAALLAGGPSERPDRKAPQKPEPRPSAGPTSQRGARTAAPGRAPAP